MNLKSLTVVLALCLVLLCHTVAEAKPRPKPKPRPRGALVVVQRNDRPVLRAAANLALAPIRFGVNVARAAVRAATTPIIR